VESSGGEGSVQVKTESWQEKADRLGEEIEGLQSNIAGWKEYQGMVWVCKKALLWKEKELHDIAGLLEEKKERLRALEVSLDAASKALEAGEEYPPAWDSGMEAELRTLENRKKEEAVGWKLGRPNIAWRDACVAAKKELMSFQTKMETTRKLVDRRRKRALCFLCEEEEKFDCGWEFWRKRHMSKQFPGVCSRHEKAALQRVEEEAKVFLRWSVLNKERFENDPRGKAASRGSVEKEACAQECVAEESRGGRGGEVEEKERGGGREGEGRGAFTNCSEV